MINSHPDNDNYASRSQAKLAFIVMKQRRLSLPIAYLQKWQMAHGPCKWDTKPSKLIENQLISEMSPPSDNVTPCKLWSSSSFWEATTEGGEELVGRHPSSFWGRSFHPSRFQAVEAMPGAFTASPRLVPALSLLSPLSSLVFSCLLLQHPGIMGHTVGQLFKQ